MLFVWVKGLRGPEPQKWLERPVRMAGKRPETLQEHELGDGCMALTLDELAGAMPYRGKDYWNGC